MITKGRGGTIRALSTRHSRAVVATTTAFAAAAAGALSTARTGTTVSIVAWYGWICEATLMHWEKQYIPRYQCLQKVQPVMVGRAAVLKMS